VRPDYKSYYTPTMLSIQSNALIQCNAPLQSFVTVGALNDMMGLPLSRRTISTH
jgi:hypothetical protein